jgi:hypothetical protein
MRLGAPLVTFGLALALSSTAAAAPPAAPGGMWDGYGPGSTVHTKMATSTEMPGMTMPPQSSEMKQTLVKTTDTEWVVKVEMKMGESWTTTENRIPRTAKGVEGVPDAPKPEEVGAESLTVDGKAYACKKWKMVVQGMTTVSWTHDEAGTLKTTMEGPSMASEMLVTSLAKKVTAAGRELTCRESTSRSKSEVQGQAMQSLVVMLTTPEVPAHTVRMESVTEMGGMMKTRILMELVSFEKK